jgi:hypothetical protein
MENLIDFAKSYYENGFSVIPVYNNKKAKGTWKDAQGNRIPPNGNFNGVNLMAIICGDASVHDGCGLEVIDIDTKYDLTGTLFKDYKKLINDNAPELLKKLVVQQTQSGGYHFIYKCKTWDGNLKLANRPTTEDELSKDAHLKSKVLIETRGQGGYFVVAPSRSYKIIYGDIFKVNEITEEERDILFMCARSFNSFSQIITPTKEYVKINRDRKSVV